ncbi:3334_t:CDS:2 [Funneliformis caledonium]|uniref:3334_t:CDS:1 n=1 Tax=Funneliformis caledonium TaxID=1117310 RepID=A0A9N9D741_9GLOM|nr:3334_t:CDS:2 [Funneliformis caledonium]
MDSTSIGGSFLVASAIKDVLSSIIDKKKHAKIADILNPFISSSIDQTSEKIQICVIVDHLCRIFDVKIFDNNGIMPNFDVMKIR